ncbi:lanthionine synthetase LanC family protein [Sinomicrobium sp. M5D2P9]
MLTEKEKRKLTGHLHQIKTDILSLAKHKEGTIFWETPVYQKDGLETAAELSLNIFNGNSGIALFFLELYKYEGNKEDLETAGKIIRFILHASEQKQKYFCFYTGFTGVPYTLLKRYEITGEEDDLARALYLSIDHAKDIVEQPVKADLLSGYAGNLFVMTLLYHYSENNTVLDIIEQLIGRFIKELRISETGLKWDYSRAKSAYDSMTGFSHGASGIAYVLLQVGNYFKSDGLVYLAEQALAYEMQYFHPESGNWLDLRMGPHRLGLEKAHRWDLEQFIPTMRNVNSWAHGASGIGISRLYAYEVTGKSIYLDQCKTVMKSSLKHLRQNDRPDYTLCSGYTGHIPFLSRYRKHSEAYDLSNLVAITDNAKEQYSGHQSYNTYVSINGKDCGLLSGKAGVGYGILHILNPDMDSICIPRLPKPHKRKTLKDYSRTYMISYIFRKYYPETIRILNTLPGLAENIRDEDIPAFERRIKQYTSTVPALEEIFNYEHTWTALWKSHKGYLCYHMKRKHYQSRAEILCSFSPIALLKIPFTLSGHVHTHPLGPELKDIIHADSGHQALILISNENGVSKTPVGKFHTLLVSYLSAQYYSADDLSDIILLRHFSQEVKTPDEILDFKGMVLKQFIEMIKTGIVEEKEFEITEEAF